LKKETNECTFKPKISKKSNKLTSNFHKKNVVNRLYNMDVLSKREKYLTTEKNTNTDTLDKEEFATFKQK